jgi:thiol-disulfide isomerase/thioredoxin
MPKNLILFLLFIPLVVFSQHSIKGNFTPAEDFTWAVLYQVTPTSKVYTAQARVSEGKFEFKLPENTPKGIYKIVYNVPQEIKNFDVIYNAKEDVELTFGEEKGAVFISSEENLLLKDYMNSMMDIGDDIGRLYGEASINKSEIKKEFKKLSETQNKFEKNATGTLALNFIKASKPYISSKYEDASTYIKNVKENYFNSVNFSDPALQGSNFLIDRAIAFVMSLSDVSEKGALYYQPTIDTIFSSLGETDRGFQKIFLKNIWRNFVENNMPDPANYIAERYLIAIATELQDEALVENLTLYKNLSIGNIAPNFSWEIEEEKKILTQSLYELNVAENYIIVFWSSSCSHCLKEIPELYKSIDSFQNNEYKAIAIGLEDENSSWRSETSYFPNFIHVLALGKWENKIGRDYDISSTPTYFVLDKDKKIIFKPENFDELQQYLNKK